ncbi:MAG: sulfite exporter TauE/SafE family protein [Saprospiraceae bacterium]|nr:sulfite exporter TauE/SafE family protein [Saprospiraceae bacterium]MBK7736250.1 sulfite exporter TauE/SafE family protein [Saprospiraceae bacterium]MBK7912384.1 sulfite exporter TauE/SafE family protein [Saprospiraceae bacterium]
MSPFEITYAIVGGFIAGCVNTLAGNGSVITLGFLTEILGIPVNLANGTNRVGIVIQGLSSLPSFHKANRLPLESSWKFLLWGVGGAIIGTFSAIYLPPNSFYTVYKFLMLALFVFMIFRGKKAWKNDIETNYLSPWIYNLVFLCFGFYGGFIQMGMGIFLLAFMMVFMKYNILEANALKIIMVSGYTLIALVIFHFYGMVNWTIGLTIAIGQGLGGWMTAHYANKIPNAETWAYRFLYFIMAITLLKLFGLLNFKSLLNI